MRKALLIALVISFTVGLLAITAMAEDKITRASSNTALGWSEIPKSICAVTKDTDNPFLGITIGLLKGIGNAFARTTSGVADVITLPAPDQGPVIKDSMIGDAKGCATK